MSSNLLDQVGISIERLARIGAFMRRYVEEGKLPGMVVRVARRGQTAYQESFGWKDIEARRPMSADSIFRIMSMTKPVTAVAAAMLYEEGHFNLNTPAYEFVPALREAKVLADISEGGPELVDQEQPITMRHLFTHTSGLSYGFDPHDPVDQFYLEAYHAREETGVPYTLASGMEAVARLPLAFQPGTRWRYGLNIDMLGYIVQVISGQPYETFLQERIFGPLGMADTGLEWPEERERVVTLYGHLPDKPGLQRVDAPLLPLHLRPGGGLFSTTRDYGRFAQMLVNGGELEGARLLSPTTVALMQINQAAPEALANGLRVPGTGSMGYGFGLGMQVLTDIAATGQAGSLGEFGWGGAYHTYFWVDRQEELYGLFMTQCAPTLYPVHTQFKTLVYQALVG